MTLWPRYRKTEIYHVTKRPYPLDALDALGHPRLAFASALQQLVTLYMDCGYDAETICVDLYLQADALGFESRPDRLLPDKG
jgi:hypothetical protein